MSLLSIFQDTNPIQAEIIKKLAEKESIIGVIGDILSHLDGDLARLVRFRLAAIEDKVHRYETVCYPWQLAYVKPFLGERIELKLIDPARIAAALQRR